MEQINLNWHRYNDHLKEMMQNLMESNESTDVTLVCEDRTKFKAHRFVLNACSPVFQSIINDLPHKDPIIFLRGVLAEEMKSILHFMYLGQATIYQDRMNNFLSVAKSLEIKEMSRDVNYDDLDSPNEEKFDENVEPNIGNLHDEKSTEIPIKVKVEIEHESSKVNSHRNEAAQLACHICDKQYTDRFCLNRHIQSIHEGIKFPCNDCGYTTTRKDRLNIHKKKTHT